MGYNMYNEDDEYLMELQDDIRDLLRLKESGKLKKSEKNILRVAQRQHKELTGKKCH